tara:strand:- start:9813 stop:10598 length:786 start_codon:yes stop_codon:yes gene_type:complete
MADWERLEGYDLTGKRALVVGFANPAGHAITEALAESGANVAVASATMDGDEVMAAKRAARTVSSLGRETFSQGWDVTLPTNVRVGLRQLVKEFGVPSVLVYNADLPLSKPIEKTGDAEFANIQAVNLNGAFYAARAWVRELQEGQTGRLIFVSSILGERGVKNLSAYAAAKAGVLGLAASLSQELAPAITVNSIATGWMDWTLGRGKDDPSQNLLLRFIPMRSFGGAENLGPLTVLLASDAAGFLSGQVFHIDGGVSNHL